MNYGEKLNIILKISTLVSEYSAIKRINSYIIKKQYRDSDSRIYNGISINKKKLYMHTKEFKLVKKNIVTKRGKLKEPFNSYMEEYFKKYHYPIYIAERSCLKLMNDENSFSSEDLNHLNKIYAEIKQNEV